MTSLGEVYGGDVNGSPRRLYLGVGLFLVGAVLLLVAIAVTATDALVSRGITVGEARELGGVLGGVGVPAMLLGISTVLPASRRTRAAAIIGASISLFGVALFYHAYPCQWVGSTCGPPTNLTLQTVGVYFLGGVTTVWCIFVGVATFKTRNDPGGTAKVDVVKNETRVVRAEESTSVTDALGGVGFFGSTPDGEVETQTAPASDGGAETSTVRTPTGTDDDGTPGGTSGPSHATGRPGGSTGGGAPTTDDAEVFRNDSSAPSGSGATGRATGSTGRSRSSAADSGGSSGGRSSGGRSTGSGRSSRPRSRDAPIWESSGDTEPETRAERERRERPAPGVKPDEGSRSTSPDGGTRVGDVRTPTGTGAGATTDPGRARSRSRDGAAGDAYCGSCAHFQYVRTDEGMQPYCAAHDELMDDMTACDEWTGRS